MNSNVAGGYDTSEGKWGSNVAHLVLHLSFTHITGSELLMTIFCRLVPIESVITLRIQEMGNMRGLQVWVDMESEHGESQSQFAILSMNREPC